MALKHAFVLTGGIASGKSTVCKILEQNDFKIIDADIVAKEQLNLHTKELKELFGDTICENDIINREKLASIIFNSKKEKKRLESLLHPLIREEISRRADKLDLLQKPYIVDIPLYFESDGYNCQMSVVVYAPAQIQLKRLMKRDGISKENAQKRIDSQIDIEKKREMADLVIDNSSDFEHLKKETEKFINFLRKKYAYNKV